jgi:hypothetical protein
MYRKKTNVADFYMNQYVNKKYELAPGDSLEETVQNVLEDGGDE